MHLEGKGLQPPSRELNYLILRLIAIFLSNWLDHNLLYIALLSKGKRVVSNNFIH